MRNSDTNIKYFEKPLKPSLILKKKANGKAFKKVLVSKLTFYYCRETCRTKTDREKEKKVIPV